MVAWQRFARGNEEEPETEGVKRRWAGVWGGQA